MEKTEIQQIIENSVTSGLGYDTSTTFLEDRNDLSWTERIANNYLVQEEDVKNTQEGLRAHLFELTYKNRTPPSNLRECEKYSKLQKRIAIYDAAMKSLRTFTPRGIFLQNTVEQMILTKHLG